MSARAEVRVKRGSACTILAPPPEPGPRLGSFLAWTNHWKPTGCASAGLAPLIRIRSVFLISRQWFVMAPLPKLAAKLTTVGPCQTRSEEHTSELQSRFDLVCRLLLEII